MRTNRGPRLPLTVRLPFDTYRECAARAKARNWSMSDYIGYCVARELDPKTHHRANPRSPSLVIDLPNE